MDYRIELRPVEALVPYERNPRRHSDEQVAHIAALIEQFGWTNPILYDDRVRAGHGRRLAALKLYDEGKTIRLPDGRALPPGTVPVIDCTGWTAAQKRAYVIADNQSALTAEWDVSLLKMELGDLRSEGFDLAFTGFLPDDIAGFMGAIDDDKAENVSLAERFGVPPFSVLNAREGWWQDRKRAWLALGIRSELGRGEQLIALSEASGGLQER